MRRHPSTIPPFHDPTIPPSHHPTIPPSHHLTIPPSYHSTIPPTHHSTNVLSTSLLPRIQAELKAQGIDGWLLFDFRGTNAIAGGLLGVEGLASRRMFAWIPREGTP